MARRPPARAPLLDRPPPPPSLRRHLSHPHEEGSRLRVAIGSRYDEGHKALQKLLAERTGDRIRVDVFPAAQLGSEVAMLEGLRLGFLDIAVAHVANASTVVPELALCSVSYLFRDRDHFERVVADPKFQKRIEELVAGKNLGLLVLIGSIVAVILLATLFPGIVLTIPRLLVPGWM